MTPKTAPLYQIICPRHHDQPIGIIADIAGARFQHGFWCKQCKAYRYFNEDSIKKYLQIVPDRYIRQDNENLTQMRQNARA